MSDLDLVKREQRIPVVLLNKRHRVNATLVIRGAHMSVPAYGINWRKYVPLQETTFHLEDVQLPKGWVKLHRKMPYYAETSYTHGMLRGLKKLPTFPPFMQDKYKVKCVEVQLI